MSRKLFAVIECNGVALVFMGTQQTRCHGRYTLGMFAAYVPRQHVARLPFSQCNQSAFVILADNGITFPVTHTRLLVHDFRTFINADSVLDHASPLLPARITLAAWFLASQMLVQVSTILLICVDMLIDRLMADLQFAFQLKPVGGLFRAEV